MAIRYEVVKDVEEMILFWKAGALVINVKPTCYPIDEYQWEPPDSGWTEQSLRDTYKRSIAWQPHEWAVMVED